MPYAPKFFIDNGVPTPAWVEADFPLITEGVYPAEAIGRMKKDGYDPYIIGNSHDIAWDFSGLVMHALGEDTPDALKTLKIGLEIMPEQLEWLQDFLHCAHEYKMSGTIRGEIPDDKTADHLLAYESHLSVTERGTIHCLAAGARVIATEHDEFQAWMEDDRADSLAGENSLADAQPWDGIQDGFTSIRREIHSLGVIERERPDVIIVGTLHALKYDLLLGRDGKRSRIFSIQPLIWTETMRMWQEAHILHRKQALRAA